jgi:dihydroorotate dehydrogenase
MLVVSVVGTAQPNGSLEELAADYALAAVWAKEAGAEAIEANLSCPNVCSGEGSLFQSPEAIRLISVALKNGLGTTPFLLKLGFLNQPALVEEVVRVAAENGAAGLAAINTIPAKVLDDQRQQALPGEGRLVSGICGAGIKEAGLEMLSRLIQARKRLGLTSTEFTLIGVGGVMTGSDVLDYLKLGVDGVQSGTGAMWNPYLARDFKVMVTTA